MSDTAADRLYALLPSIMRRRDGDAGAATAARLGFERGLTDEDGPLKALLGILGTELAVLEAEAEALYDDHFIETCADWVVPYIGALIGARIVDTGDAASARRQVADTIANRRGKGTARSLARRAAGLMGPPAEAIEYFQHLVTALHLDYPGTNPPMSVALHGPRPPLPGDPTRIGQHVPEIRASGGTFAVPFIGVRSWPMEALTFAELVPTPIAGGDPGRFRLSPIGDDMALWRSPGIDDPNAPRLSLDEIPGPLGLRDTAARHQQQPPGPAYGRSLALSIDGTVVRDTQICFCNLEDSLAGPASWNGRGRADDLDRVRIDPERGRLMLPPTMLGLTADSLRLFVHYGAATRVGGGGYDRGAAAIGASAARIGDSLTRTAAETALAAALGDLGNVSEVAIGYGGPLTPPALITLPQRRTVRITADGPGVWPTLFAGGDVEIRAGAGTTLILEGLRIAGGAINIATRNLAGLVLRDCTLVPGRSLTPGGAATDPTAPALMIQQPGLEVTLERCVIGPIRCEPTVALTINDCIVDAPDANTAAIRGVGVAADRYGGRLTAQASTFIGDVRLASFIEVSDCIFARRHGRTRAFASVDAERLQTGCVRYSALPPDARAPRRYRCAPDEAAALPALPIFVSTRYGAASYATLVPATSPTILLGAEDGGEMGVMNRVSTTRKQAALLRDLPDWIPFGNAAGIQLMTE